MLRERRRHANFKPNRKLDRKSSRGMIYENEELRLRTININAEVERGQSDIKKLRRENFQLRKEIWTLRDEYDRLGKVLKNKSRSNEQSLSDSHDCGLASDCKHACEYDDVYRCCSCHLDEDSVSCDMCNENERAGKDFADRPTKSTNLSYCPSNKLNQASMPKPMHEKIDLTFDHLSVVSEECMSNSDEQSNHKSESKHESEGEPNEEMQDPIYSNFQSTIPPLKHFENLSYKDIGPNIDESGEIHFNGESYETNEPTPPPPSPPPLPIINRRNSSLPLPPPPPLTDDLNTHDESNENETSDGDKSSPKYFFTPLKCRRASTSKALDSRTPDVFVNNALPADGNRLATIRKPHNPLKYPSNTNPASIDDEAVDQLDAILNDIQGLSKGIKSMQMYKNPTYENVKSVESDSDQPHPYRTEMSLILSYNGNKSKHSTNSIVEKTRESDVDSLPPNIPHAMKLLPNTLMYANDHFTKTNTSESGEQLIEKTDNSANEEIVTNSHANEFQSYEKPNAPETTTSTKHEKAKRNDKSYEYDVNGDVATSTVDENACSNSRPTTKDSSESQELNETGEASKSCENRKSRRVSILFNGQPMPEQQENEVHSNDSTLDAEELLAATPICTRRSRRSSCSRKLSDESLGSFLYPTNPFTFGAYKRRRPSFLSRRHSDSLIPAHQTQLHMLDYGVATKTNHHCHRNHMHHHHQNGDNCGAYNPTHNGNNIGESTATSICNSNGSSRESLASLSQQSRRKISITSHSKSGGKIPWCACWGNGCI